MIPPTRRRRFIMLLCLARVAHAEEGAPDPAGTQVVGWTQFSYTLSTSDDSVSPVANNDFPGDLMLQQNWLGLERVAPADPARVTSGYKASIILPGTDYRFTGAEGLLDKQTHRLGIDPFEFHLDLKIPRGKRFVDVNVGRFPAMLGAEYVDAPRNVLVSRSLIYNATPSSHTGIQGTMPVSDQLSLSAGIVTGSDVFVHDSAETTFISNAVLVPRGTQDMVGLFWVKGPAEHNVEHGIDHPEVLDLVYIRQVEPGLVFTLEGVVGRQRGIPEPDRADLDPVPGAAAPGEEEEEEVPAEPAPFPAPAPGPRLLDEEWKGLALYLTKSLTPEITGTVRYELFKDGEGLRFGFPGLYENISACLARTHGKWITRGELRYDEHLDGQTPFEGKTTQAMASFDVVRRW